MDADRPGADPYVRRDVDDQLDRALAANPFVLLVGDSKAGKSRTAYEAACRYSRSRGGDVRLVKPATPATVEELLDLDPAVDLAPVPALLWLDDLDETALGALTPRLLDRLADKAVILASSPRRRRGDREDRPARPGPRHPHRPARQARGHRTGRQLLADYQDAREGAHLAGWAVVQAAIDWTRMAVGRPINLAELHQLFPVYLRQHRAHPGLADTVDSGLAWATKPLASPRRPASTHRRGPSLALRLT